MSHKDLSKEKLDDYLYELGKEYRKITKNAFGEIVIVGGASILLNYSFRMYTNDVDSLNYSESAIKEAIQNVAVKYNLDDHWLNFDFSFTSSNSPNIASCSKLYKKIGNFTIRTIDREFLLVMKTMSFRSYKHDMSDIVGIIMNQRAKNDPITLAEIRNASIRLYGSYEALPEEGRIFLEKIIEDEDLIKIYEEVKNDEAKNQVLLSEALKGNDLTPQEKADAKALIERIRKESEQKKDDHL